MYVVNKRLRSAAIAHRLGNGYPGKCKNLHGHNYDFEVEVGVETLDKFGMAIDFGDIKKVCCNWIQENWDHKTIVAAEDGNLRYWLESEGSEHYVFPTINFKPTNTTAENMSCYLAEKFKELLSSEWDLTYINVKVWETSDSYASYCITP